jgi:hypothetical protein
MKSSAILALGYILVISAAPLIPTTTFPGEPEPKAYRVAPIRRPPGHEERRRAATAEAEAIESGRLAPALEEEAAIKPTQRAPSLSLTFDGMDFNDTPGFVPPDTHAATGPDYIVETVNTTVAFFDRTTGAKVFQQDLSDFFSSVDATTNLTDPVVAYDELAQRFFIGVIDFGSFGDTSNLLYAVSDSSDPTAGFTEKYSIDVTEVVPPGSPVSVCTVGDTVLTDFTRVGWNADAHIFTFNMFNVAGTCYDHVTIIAIDKTNVLDANTLTVPDVFHIDLDGFTNFTVVPAVMHGSLTGDPMWFVEESAVLNGIRVVEIDNILSLTPTLTATDLLVASYNFPPPASQKGGGFLMDTGDSRILNVEWRDNRLVASQTVGIAGNARARWYEFDVSGTPSLTQQGTISPGPGIHTYYPSIAIAANGDLGMTFMQSSNNEFVSMYVTGRFAAEPPGAMQTPALVKAGLRNYTSFDCTIRDGCRAGDYSGITADPDSSNVFCAANEYATSDVSENWGTSISCFSLSGTHDLAVTAITAPKKAKGSPVTLPVKVTIQNRSDHGETVQSSDLGDGVSTGLVRLSLSVVDDDFESCAPAIVALDGLKNAALFSGGPAVIATGKSLTVNFLVTYDCSGRLNIKKDRTSGDYSHTATVHHEALAGGTADNHAADDTCPRAALFDPNPPPKGTKDKGCGGKRGTPVLTNVTP